MQIKIFNSRQLNETREFNLDLATTNQKKECFIGRSPASNLVLDSPDVSRLHGKLFQQNGIYYFIDIGSRNGSIINGKLAEINQKYQLKPGDIVRIGEFVLIMEEMDVLRQDLAETVFGNVAPTATTINNADNLASPAIANNDNKAIAFEAATFIQIPEPLTDEIIVHSPANNSDIEPVQISAQPPIELDIFAESHSLTEAELRSISESPTQIEVFEQREVVENAILVPDPWQDLELELESQVFQPNSSAELEKKPVARSNVGVAIATQKYIALMAHDRQKSELTEMVARHQAFFAQSLTIATPTTSLSLQQVGLEVSAETPALPIGGYQAIANLVNSGNIMAVILLEDVLPLPESERENQEALLRACNLNQVLLATNLSTAEAILSYLKSSDR